MGKLLTGHYGQDPEAESTTISLNECRQRLGLKPSDFVSAGAPDFFNKKYGAKGRYLLFLIDGKETESNPVWRPGYYLLPLEAAEVLRVFDQNRVKDPSSANVLPVKIETRAETVPEAILMQAQKWSQQCQPLFFKCGCEYLGLKLTPPWTLRRRWKGRLACPGRCQPAMTTEFC